MGIFKPGEFSFLIFILENTFFVWGFGVFLFVLMSLVSVGVAVVENKKGVGVHMVEWDWLLAPHWTRKSYRSSSVLTSVLLALPFIVTLCRSVTSPAVVEVCGWVMWQILMDSCVFGGRCSALPFEALWRISGKVIYRLKFGEWSNRYFCGWGSNWALYGELLTEPVADSENNQWQCFLCN